MPVELVGYEDEEAGNSNCEVRSLRLQSWEVHIRERVEELIKPYIADGWNIVGEIKENQSSILYDFVTYSVTLERDYIG